MNIPDPLMKGKAEQTALILSPSISPDTLSYLKDFGPVLI